MLRCVVSTRRTGLLLQKAFSGTVSDAAVQSRDKDSVLTSLREKLENGAQDYRMKDIWNAGPDFGDFVRLSELKDTDAYSIEPVHWKVFFKSFNSLTRKASGTKEETRLDETGSTRWRQIHSHQSKTERT